MKLATKSNELFFNYSNLLITLPTLFLSAFIGVYNDNVLSYISVLGGFFCVIIAFLMPGVLYIKNNNYPFSHYKNIGTLVIITFLCAIGFISGLITIFDNCDIKMDINNIIS